MTVNPVVNELLFACRLLNLRCRSSETNPDGPWRAQCPVCRTYSSLDELPLIISSNGHLRCAHKCDPERIADALHMATEAQQTVSAPGEQPTTWAAIPLDPVLNGDNSEMPPSMLARTGGRCLLYAGRVHAFHAEPEALKTWLALAACAECLRASERVGYIDFEDSATSIVQRLLSLGVDREEIAYGLAYIRPDEPLANAALHDLDAALEPGRSLVIVDGVTEAFSRQGLNPLDNIDIATWLDVLPPRLVRSGAAVVLLDHVVKDKEARGRFAIGGQHKLAGIDVAYGLKVIEPFARGRDGAVAIRVEKDRPGRVREFAKDAQVATLRATSGPNGAVRIKLEPPEHGRGSGFRPTTLMERASRAIEADPGLSKRAIRETVGGKAGAVDLGLEMLIAEGFIEPRRDGQAIRHHSIRPYREMDDQTDRVPLSQPCPGHR